MGNSQDCPPRSFIYSPRFHSYVTIFHQINASNTILSTYIADAQIAYSGSGPLNANSDPGITTKIVNWLF